MFQPGETVTGTVRSIETYGVFVELTPNLAGLAEPCDYLLRGSAWLYTLNPYCLIK